MTIFENSSGLETVGVSLVDGDSTVRHARQLMLLAKDYDVRSYATSAALLADPRSRDYGCIVVDVEMRPIDGPDLLRQMRSSGWRGKAVLLDALGPSDALKREAESHGDTILDRAVDDRALTAAISASVDRGWNSWTATG